MVGIADKEVEIPRFGMVGTIRIIKAQLRFGDREFHGHGLACGDQYLLEIKQGLHRTNGGSDEIVER